MLVSVIGHGRAASIVWNKSSLLPCLKKPGSLLCPFAFSFIQIDGSPSLSDLEQVKVQGVRNPDVIIRFALGARCCGLRVLTSIRGLRRFQRYSDFLAFWSLRRRPGKG